MTNTLNLNQVLKITGFKISWLVTQLEAGHFPREIEPGKWLKTDIEGWQQSRTKQAFIDVDATTGSKLFIKMPGKSLSIALPDLLNLIKQAGLAGNNFHRNSINWLKGA